MAGKNVKPDTKKRSIGLESLIRKLEISPIWEIPQNEKRSEILGFNLEREPKVKVEVIGRFCAL